MTGEAEFTLHGVTLKPGRVMTSFPFSHIQPGVHQKMFAFLIIPGLRVYVATHGVLAVHLWESKEFLY